MVRRGSTALAGRTVVITRARAQSAPLVSALERRGAQVVLFPTIEIVPVTEVEPIERAVDALDDVDWIIFTSANSVVHFLRCVETRGLPVDVLRAVKVAAIGSATAAVLEAHDVPPLVVPERAQAEGLIDALDTEEWRGRRVLIPRAETARNVLPDALRRRGAHVDILVVYRTVRPATDPVALRTALQAGEIEAITFTSPSTVRHFAEFFDVGEAVDLLTRGHVAVVCIGPVTSKTARQAGLHVAVEADVATVEALVRGLERHFAQGGAPPRGRGPSVSGD